jgi:phospholipase/carboxylesterase
MLSFRLIKQGDLNLMSYVEINPTTPCQKTVIWLHGLGADGHDFVPIVSELQLPASTGIRFLFPHAPVMPVTLNNGYEMPAWFDIYDLARINVVDENGIKKSIATVEALIAKEEARGISSNNIILAGFSQGAVIALITALGFTKPLGGVLALSGYLPMAEKVLQHATTVNRTLPIFVAHGTADSVLPFAFGEATYKALTQAGYQVDWHSYNMPHTVCPEEIRDISAWLQAR